MTQTILCYSQKCTFQHFPLISFALLFWEQVTISHEELSESYNETGVKYPSHRFSAEDRVVCLFVFSKMKIRARLYRHQILIPGPRVRSHVFARMSTISPPARHRNSFSDQNDNLCQSHITPMLEISHCDQIPRQDIPSTSFLAKNSVSCIYYIILHTS